MIFIFIYLHLFFLVASFFQLTHIHFFKAIQLILLQFAKTLYIEIKIVTKATKNMEKAKLEEIKEIVMQNLLLAIDIKLDILQSKS